MKVFSDFAVSSQYNFFSFGSIYKNVLDFFCFRGIYKNVEFFLFLNFFIMSYVQWTKLLDWINIKYFLEKNSFLSKYNLFYILQIFYYEMSACSLEFALLWRCRNDGNNFLFPPIAICSKGNDNVTTATMNPIFLLFQGTFANRKNHLDTQHFVHTCYSKLSLSTLPCKT